MFYIRYLCDKYYYCIVRLTVKNKSSTDDTPSKSDVELLQELPYYWR